MKVEFITDNKEIEIVNVRLSDNPDAEILQDETGVDGYINITDSDQSEPIKYYIIDFMSIHSPLSLHRSRVMFQSLNKNGNPVWRRITPNKAKEFIGSVIPGDIVTREVIPYKINDKLVNVATYVVLPGENIYKVFKGHGHIIVENKLEGMSIIKEETMVNEMDSSKYQLVCDMIENINNKTDNKDEV